MISLDLDQRPQLARVMALAGAILLLLGVMVPAVRGPSIGGPLTSDPDGYRRGSTDSLDVAQKLFTTGSGEQFVLILLGLGALILIWRAWHDESLPKALTGVGVGALIVVGMAWMGHQTRLQRVMTQARLSIYDQNGTRRYIARMSAIRSNPRPGLFPPAFRPGQAPWGGYKQLESIEVVGAMSWAWWLLFPVAALLIGAPLIGGSAPVAVKRAGATASQRVDFGPCARCGTKNSHLVSRCRECGELLPWAQPPTVVVTTAKAQAPRLSVPKPSLRNVDWGFWGVGVFSFFIPIIGYFLYQSYTRNGDDKAGAAGMGALLGVGAIILRIAVKLALHH